MVVLFLVLGFGRYVLFVVDGVFLVFLFFVFFLIGNFLRSDNDSIPEGI